MDAMEEAALRLQCLTLAAGHNCPPAEMLRTAEAFFDFVKNGKTAKAD